MVQQAAQTQQKLQQILAAPNPDPATAGQLVMCGVLMAATLRTIRTLACSGYAPMGLDQLDLG